MATLIPFRPSVPFYDFSTTIENVDYQFNVRWNGRENRGKGAWFFDVYETDGTVIAEGVKIVLGAYLARWVNHPLFREGVIVAVCTADSGKDAGFDDIGVTGEGVSQRVQVMRLTLAEVLSLRVTAAYPDETELAKL